MTSSIADGPREQSRWRTIAGGADRPHSDRGARNRLIGGIHCPANQRECGRLAGAQAADEHRLEKEERASAHTHVTACKNLIHGITLTRRFL
jgi:hypothetical protein